MTFDPKEARTLVSRAKGRITPCNATTADIVSLCTSLTAALTEIERLRDALRKLERICKNRQPDKVADGAWIARKALKGDAQ